nr:glycerophosphoryl diester phosphodiesterase membrane domain-containing protein [Lentilactobacillus kisonensis]
MAAFFFFLGYFILVLPFSYAYFSSPLLAKVSIPVFIIDDLQQSPWLSALIAILTVTIFYIGVRLIQVLPLMILDNQTGFAAAKTAGL